MKRLKVLCDESGQALVFSLLAMTVLFGFLGFAVDVGVLLRAKRAAQTAADSAAIAAALEYNYADMQTAAQDAAAQNGVVIGTNGGAVTVNSPPQYGAYKLKPGYVEAIVSQDQPTGFMGMISHLTSMTVTARAVATNGASNGCIYTLDPSGTDISITGNASIQVPNCGVVDNSTSKCAMDLTGNITLKAQSIGVAGTACSTGNVHVSPKPVQGIAPVGDPLAYIPTPAPTGCTTLKITGNTTKTISPGCYNGISLTGNQSVSLDPGTYVINGSLSMVGNTSMSGTGVTLVLLGSGSSGFTGNTNVNLTAPTSGTYNGILIEQPSSNTSALTLTGNSGSTLKGIIYAPSAPVKFTGNSGSNVYTDFVVGSLTLVGNAGFNDYASIAGDNTPLTAAKLVE